ncbi:hypothetical protein JCM10213_007891 [Rhodosporidiobolus nylandii]
MPLKPLSPSSLPLHFALLRPLSGSSSPAAVLSTRLPLRPHPTLESADLQDDQLQQTETLDLRDGAEEPTVEVVRTLDPENREPFVSLSRLFLACSLSPLEGLLRFSLDPLSFSLSLGGLGPFLDLWLPLSPAREIAAELGRLDELDGLLEWDTRAAWSIEDREEGGVVHNWKIPSSHLDPQTYSTSLMLSTPFPRLVLLSAGQQVRTLLPPSSSFPHAAREDSWEGLWAKCVEWSVREYEAIIEGGGEEQTLLSPPLSGTSSGSGTRSPFSSATDEAEDLAPLYTFTALASLLSLHSLLPLPSTPSSLAHLPTLTLPRAALLPPSFLLSSPAGARAATAYLCDFLSRLVAHGWMEAQRASLGLQREGRRRERQKQEREERAKGEWREDLDRRVKGLEMALREAEARSPVTEKANPGTAAGAGEVQKLRRELRALSLTVSRLSSAAFAPPMPAPAASQPVRLARVGGLDAQAVFAFVAVFVLGVAVGVGVS